ncbi:MAG: glutamate-5-semialdehyde dehydrogenase [Chlorobiales bacterium]|jgi:glutamate-5-semialdehyde dehydrogenase|nr:glutamate-5-semialdehyde dehydrogenase [Chlorobiales bacterium]
MEKLIHQELRKAQEASRKLALLEDEKINQVLLDLADAALAQTRTILEANKKDLERMNPNDPKYDRLLLSEARLQGIASDIRNVATLKSPIGKVIEERTLPNGLELSRVTVPLGVVGIIYEARPNVTFDVFSLCLKSGNVSVLKGGSDAHFSNQATVSVIHQVLEKHGLDPYTVYLLPSEREAAGIMMNAIGLIDVIIPRGSQGLIDSVRQNSKVPVIETGAGIVHTYFDETGDLEKGKAIVFNAKTRRPSVCNALDTLIIHEKRLSDLAALISPLKEKKVEIFADSQALTNLKGHYPDELLHEAMDKDFGTEFLSLKMSIKTVSSTDEALDHIARYSSKHSEAIISNDEKITERFLKSVDAAVVYANTSTAFTDGAQFGLGAEIGISTQKLHARGPMALAELCSYKWIIRGNGQVRSA